MLTNKIHPTQSETPSESWTPLVALLYENKKIQWQNVTPSENWTQDTLLSELTWHVLLKGSLNFCPYTTLFLDWDDLVRINGAWQC